MTFYGLSCVFLTQPQFASLQRHSGHSCSRHVGLFSPKKHFFGSTSLQIPVWHLSWRSQSICDCLVEMGLNYSNPSCSLLMGYWCEETDRSHSLCGQSPWRDSRDEISLPLSQMVFFARGCLGLSDPHFHQFLEQSGKGKKKSAQYLQRARLYETLYRPRVSLKTCKFGRINLLGGDSFRRIKYIDQGHELTSGGAKFKFRSIDCKVWLFPPC